MSRFPPAHCGVGEYTRMLVSSIVSLRGDVEALVVATEKSGSAPYESECRVRVYPVLRESQPDYSGLLDVLTSIGGADIVHVQHEYGIFRDGRQLASVLSEAAAERLTGAIVVTMHTVYHPYSGRGDALEFQASIGNIADTIIVHSRLQEFELASQGVGVSKITRIPHGTLINPYTGLPRQALAESIGLPPSKLNGFILVTPGFLRPDKGLDVLLEALQPLEGRIRYTFIAAGEPRDSVLLSLLGRLRGAIVLPRYLSHDEILRLIALSDAVVLPYRDKPGSYSVSGILHLAMGALKPIIGSRVPRLVELYERAPRMCVAPGDPAALADKILWLHANYDVAVPYMSEVYAYAARTQWPRVARRHLMLYKRLLEAARRGLAVAR